jgi:hypothetical protein
VSGAKRAMADISVSERGSVAYQSLRRSYLSATTSRERMCRGRSAPEPTRAGRSIFAQGIFGQLSVFAIRMKALLLKLAMGIVNGCDSPEARLFQQRLSFSPRFAFRPPPKRRPMRGRVFHSVARAPRGRGRQAMGPIEISGGEVPSGLRRASTTLKNAPGPSPLLPYPSSTPRSRPPPPTGAPSRAFRGERSPLRPRTAATTSSRTNAKLARFTSFAPHRSDDVHDEPLLMRRLFRRRRVRHPRGHHRGRGRG